MEQKKYVGFLKRNKDKKYLFSHYITTNFKRISKWQKTWLEYPETEGCLIYELNNINYHIPIKAKFNNIDIFNDKLIKLKSLEEKEYIGKI